MTFGVEARTTKVRRLLAAALLLFAAIAQAQNAEVLRARHDALSGTLDDNAFRRPIHLESHQFSDHLSGDVYARVEQPFRVVAPALQGMERWCDILILHLNVKQCRASTPLTGEILTLDIGRKFDQPLKDAYRFEFLYSIRSVTNDYLRLELSAEEGPIDTGRYRILLEAIALDDDHSFLHLSYAFDHGLVARMMMRSYLTTLGRNKVGFSVVGTRDDGRPIYIGGARGVVERNTMRYYLAIEAYLGALAVPMAARLEKRLNDWHTGIERYPLQLQDLTRAEYLTIKHKEIQRQQRPPALASVTAP